MSARGFDCPNCGHVGEPAEVDREVVVGCWYVVCSNCSSSHIVREAFADARIEEHRREERT
jgi:transcription elongation factor Elf1